MRVIYGCIISLLMLINCHAARLKDITTLAGIRDNQLIGYGLVVGLDRTGDLTNQTPFTAQTFRNMLLQFGIRMPEGGRNQINNVAAVAVSATLYPFARIGQKVDITVSALGNASSLRGGTLLMLPLRGADNQVYAVAQGNVVVSGVESKGRDGTSVSVNFTTTGRIPNGATIEKTIPMPYVQNGVIVFELIDPDFTTSQRIAETINHELGYPAAQPIDAGAVAVKVNQFGRAKTGYLKQNSYVTFISDLENLKVRPGEVAARVVANSRSGTIVIGQDVTVSPVGITHGNLTISVSETPYVSQPGAFSRGHTVKGSDSDVQINQQKSHVFVFAPAASLKDLVDALNRVGAAPSDLISILEAIKESGALHADLEII